MVIHVILLDGFEKWLITLGYADSTVYGSVRYVTDFSHWLMTTPIENLEQVDSTVIRTYYKHLQSRKSKRGTGSLSDNYIISHINALKRFSRYLSETGKGQLEIDIKPPRVSQREKTILTMEEIKAMYKACGAGETDLAGILGIRDRAILSIYYGCGLRRSEGIALNTSDVQIKEKLVYVKKGKNYRERYVPMSEAVKDDLESYIKTARRKILSFKKIRQDVYLPDRQALFLSLRAERLGGNQMIERIHHLARQAGVQKDIGLHSLRHSIATHLLQKGMSLEQVSQFLGHRSLESTQIYTHIANEQIS
jgi:integrase/recombinase XerD